MSQYCNDGKKMCNLQLVVVFRDNQGVLKQVQVSNFANQESNDANYVADVMDLHMKGKAKGGSGLLDHFKKITISGDHGVHFSDVQTVFNESRMFEKYNKEVHIVSLCSYHCYNRCDAAGVHSKKLAHAQAKRGNPLKTAKEYTQSVMQDKRPDTLAFEFEEINRSADVFGSDPLAFWPQFKLREMCEISFDITYAGGQRMRCPGVIKCRPVPFEGEWLVMDLRKPVGDELCFGCTQRRQYPVERSKDCCIIIQSKTDLKLNLNTEAIPDPGRLIGLQMTKKVKALLKGGVEKDAALIAASRPFQCETCKKRYKHKTGLDKHVRAKHLPDISVPGVLRQGQDKASAASAAPRVIMKCADPAPDNIQEAHEAEGEGSAGVTVDDDASVAESTAVCEASDPKAKKARKHQSEEANAASANLECCGKTYVYKGAYLSHIAECKAHIAQWLPKVLDSTPASAVAAAVTEPANSMAAATINSLNSDVKATRKRKKGTKL